jgi:L-lysine exporter family protein LysE/ArgO
VYLDTVVLVGVVGAQHGQQRWWFGAGAAAASFAWFSALGHRALAAPLFARPGAWGALDILTGATMLALASALVLQQVGHQV